MNLNVGIKPKMGGVGTVTPPESKQEVPQSDEHVIRSEGEAQHETETPKPER